MQPTVSEALLDLVDGLAARELSSSDEGLAEAVRRVSDSYTRDRDVLSQGSPDTQSLAARLRFFLPRDLPKLWGPLSELQRVGALPDREALRVLDLGCGLGTTSLAAALFLDAAPAARALHITALDRDARALSLMESLVTSVAEMITTPIELQTRRVDLRNAELPRDARGFDVILAGLVLNELTQDAPTPDEALRRGRALVDGLTGRLSPDGVIIIIEPALRPQARLLQQLRDELATTPSQLHVFAPCTHDSPCPLLQRKRDWCHERWPAVLPERLARVAARAGLREQGLTYSYLTLTRSTRSVAELSHGHGPSHEAGHALRAVSGPLSSKGKVELDVCGPGGLCRLMQLRRGVIAPGQDLTRLGRGTVLSLSGDSDGAGATAAQQPRKRLKGGEVRVHQAWSATASVIDTLPERSR